MIRDRVVGYRERVQTRLRATFSQDHPPHFIAVSFAIGVFMTTLPTLGTGLIVLAAIGYRYAWANNLALFAAVVVLNPVAKTGVYSMSFILGTILLGSPPGITNPEIGLTAGREILVRLLAGNAIIAVVFALVGYAFAHYGVRAVRRYKK
ncbi:hypothetical protein AArcSl_0273 [Halalkaliarchaeum desulfuricum]|uniref:DUF2062 domain-containing protein n=1 Tax=Halalkaliarchaeum desulfuricum TaxID=2055893 RepID=A0A343TFQ6_9EURY|nr:DUF2062 domain-containing protein [Halalkaliarchaeum desulfuricum]AUX07928.1 hypothetical protein AArcSl_0273 [Halalkaliarchaeum desulfuricum]